MHLLNIALHVGAGSAAIVLGFVILSGAKGDALHLRRGRLFAALTLLVCGSAALGNLLFRFMPLFAVLTLLVLYQFLGGWHAARTREAGPGPLDALMTASALAGACMLAPLALAAAGPSPVLYSTLATLAALLMYDSVRWLFPRRWFGTLWRYEHIYKMVASLFGMLSAASGNLLAFAQPWSQLLPSALGIATIGLLWYRGAQAPAPRSAHR